jgi:hypothetical protein
MMPAMSQRLRSFEDLVAFLNEKKIPHRGDASMQAVELGTAPPALPQSVILRWDTKVPFLQIMQPITNPVPDERVHELEAAVCRLNDIAMIPGYGYSYGTKVVYYRFAAPRYDNEIGTDTLDRAIGLVISQAAQVEPAIKKVVEGAPGANVLELVKAIS